MRALTAAVIVALSLSGCIPPDDGLLGIQRETDGSLTALVRVCRDEVTSMRLLAINSHPAERGGDAWIGSELFSASELALVEPGQVLTIVHTEPVSRDAFESAARDYCTRLW